MDATDKNNSPKNIIGIVFFILLIAAILYSNSSSFVFLAMAAYFAYIFFRKRNNILKSINLNKNPMENPINANAEKITQSVGKGGKIAIKVVALIVIVWIFFQFIVIVDAGETGVYSLFGKVRDQELRSGFHLVNPLAKVTKMTIRTEQYTMSIVQAEGQVKGDDSINALTKEGLNVALDITALYHLDEQRASDIYKEVGINYEEKIIRPGIRSAIRAVIAQYEAKDIYSEKRQEVSNRIFDSLGGPLKERGIVTEEILLRNVQLPANLAKSIQEKLQAEQEAQKYDFVLQKEQKEAERKRIEAAGQRDAQAIVNESLTEKYINYLYVRDLKDREGTIYVPTNPSTGVPLFRGIGN